MSKLFISADIEGVAGVVHWDQVRPGSTEYQLGQRLLMAELGSLCRGAAVAGAEAIVVNDSHSTMRNVIPDGLPDNTRLISGHFKPMYMMEGLDASFDAAVFHAYHGPAGSASVLSHTYNPRVIWEARLNGEVTGETGINAMVAHHYGVPVILITGDGTTIEDAKRWVPEAVGLVTKRSLGRFAADSIGPKEAERMIFAGVQSALANIKEAPQSPAQPVLELTLQSEEMAELSEWIGAARLDRRVVRLEGENGIDLYRKFHLLLILARTVADA